MRVALSLTLLFCTAVTTATTVAAHAEERPAPVAPATEPDADQVGGRRYEEPVPRPHNVSESFQYIAFIYLASTAVYLGISHDEVFNNATFQNYWTNFGNIAMFDQDLPSANWGVHFLTGAVTYEFYRARSYTMTDAWFMTLITECLYQFTVETVIQPTGLENVLNTGVMGVILGRGMELVSLPMLNSDFFLWRGVGYVLNIPALLGFWESQTRVAPILGGGKAGISLEIRF